MATKGKIEAGAEFDISAWNKGINDLISSAGQAEKAVDSLIKTLNNVKVGGATGAFVIQVDDTQIKDAIALRGELSTNTDFMAGVNTSELSTAQTAHDELFENTEFVASVQEMEIEDAIALRNDLNEATSFNVQVGKGEIEAAQQAHDDLNQNTSFTASVSDSELEDAKNKRDDLDNNTSFTANVNTEEIDEAVRKKTDLEGTTEIKANVDDTEVKNLVEQIRNLQAVDIGFTVGGAALGAGKSVFDFAAGGILEMDTALLKLQGTTNESIPGARELIEDLYVNAWGESRTQIAEVLALGTQLGISQDQMADALLSAFEVASVTGEDVNKVLRAQDQLVKQGLTPSYREAGNVIVDGFTQGGNRADDLFDTIIEYGSTFKGLGLSAQEATQLVVNGMDAGAMNTDLAADALREFGIRARDLGAQATIDVYKELNLEDTVQGFRDGTVSGKELLTQVFERMEGLDPSEQARMGLELFGTQSEDLGMHVIEALNPATLALEDIGTAASDAATMVNGDLATSFTELKRTVETELATAIDNTFDISDLIDKAKEAVITFADEIQAGDSVFGALGSATGNEGLEQTMLDIQRVFTDIGTGLLKALGAIAEFFGADDAKEFTDGLIAGLAEIQLDTDMFGEDSQEQLAERIRIALERGADTSEVGLKVQEHLRDLIDSGDLPGAQDFIDAMNLEAQDLPVEDVINLDAFSIELRQKMEESVNAALDQGDLITAANFAFDEGLRQELTAEISDTLYEGAMTGFTDVESRLQAVDFAAFLTGGMGIEALEERVGSEIADSVLNGLINDFTDAIDSGDLDLAQRIADTLSLPALQAEIDRVTEMLGEATETTKEDMKEVEDASRVSAESMGKTFEKLGTDTKTSFDSVQESTGDTTSKLDQDTDSMEGSVIGLAGELLLQSFAMGLSFLAISSASQAMQEGISESMQLATDDYLAFSDTVIADSDLMTGAFQGIQDYTVTWADVMIEEFQLLGSEFSIMVDSVQTNGGRLIDTLTQLSSDMSTIDLSVDATVTTNGSGGGDSGGTSGDTAGGDSGGTINGMARRDINYRADLTRYEAFSKAMNGLASWETDSEGNRALVVFEDRDLGYYRHDAASDTYKFVKNPEFGRVSGEQYNTSDNQIFGSETTSTGGSTSSGGTRASSGTSINTSGLNRSIGEFSRAVDTGAVMFDEFASFFRDERVNLPVAIAAAVSSIISGNNTTVSNTVNVTTNNPAATASALTTATQMRGF